MASLADFLYRVDIKYFTIFKIAFLIFERVMGVEETKIFWLASLAWSVKHSQLLQNDLILHLRLENFQKCFASRTVVSMFRTRTRRCRFSHPPLPFLAPAATVSRTCRLGGAENVLAPGRRKP